MLVTKLVTLARVLLFVLIKWAIGVAPVHCSGLGTYFLRVAATFRAVPLDGYIFLVLLDQKSMREKLSLIYSFGVE